MRKAQVVLPNVEELVVYYISHGMSAKGARLKAEVDYHKERVRQALSDPEQYGSGFTLYRVEKFASAVAELEFYNRKQVLLKKVGKLLREIRQLKRTRVQVDTGVKHHKVGKGKRHIILDD